MSWQTPLPVEEVRRGGEGTLDFDDWPATVPAIRQILVDGLTLGPATVLVGENGVGKSTVVEAIAIAYGLSPEGGSTGARLSTRVSESSLAANLFLRRGVGASRWGYFLRAETMHGLFTYLEDNPGFRGRDPRFHELSHGESFLEMLSTERFASDGFFVMDEPEAGLSFVSQLALLAELTQLSGQAGTQVLIATHSPILAALPGATLLELGDDGLHETSWDDLALVEHYRAFLDAPQRYLRHLG